MRLAVDVVSGCRLVEPFFDVRSTAADAAPVRTCEASGRGEAYACGNVCGSNTSNAPAPTSAINATTYCPAAAAMAAKHHAPMAPSPAHSPFMLSMKFKALVTVSIHSTVAA